MQGDGVTPAVGVAVTFSSGGRGAGQASFVACGAATCVVATDGAGMASTTVAGLTRGS